MVNKHISDELLAAYLDGNTNEGETLELLNAAQADPDLQEVLDIALLLDEEELPLQIAAESGRNLCEVHCEAYILKQYGIEASVEELLEVSKTNHWIRSAGTPLQYMGNLLDYKGLKVVRMYKATLKNVRDTMDKGNHVIVAVDSDKLYPELPDEEDATNHAVVITGLDTEKEMVTIYDPANISEVDIKMSLFLSAWNESHYYMVSVGSAN